MTTNEEPTIDVRQATRLEEFERNADELWKLWNDPLVVSEHLSDLLRGRRPSSF